MSNGDARQTNLALVQRMYDCFNRDDLATIRNEIFAPDLVWNLPGHNPVAGNRKADDRPLCGRRAEADAGLPTAVMRA